MSEADIQVILNELKNIKDDITEIKGDVKDKCANCVRTEVMKATVDNFVKMSDDERKKIWLHIYAQWAVIGAFALMIATNYFQGISK
jgi:predicted Fe-S protein YdhL (DUF1289 family)